jgi:hypothetical protein
MPYMLVFMLLFTINSNILLGVSRFEFGCTIAFKGNYDLARNLWTEEENSRRIYLYLSCGLTAGLLSTIITHPIDVIKTRMQLDPRGHIRFFRSVSLILKEDGFVGFFRGLVPRGLRKTISTALTWTLFEENVRWIKKIWNLSSSSSKI